MIKVSGSTWRICDMLTEGGSRSTGPSEFKMKVEQAAVVVIAGKLDLKRSRKVQRLCSSS